MEGREGKRKENNEGQQTDKKIKGTKQQRNSLLDLRGVGCQQGKKMTKRQQHDGKLDDKKEGFLRDNEDERKEGAGKRGAGLEMGWVGWTKKGKGRQNTNHTDNRYAHREQTQESKKRKNTRHEK